MDGVATQSLVKRRDKICEAGWSSGTKLGCCGTEATGGFHQARWASFKDMRVQKAGTRLDRGFKVLDSNNSTVQVGSRQTK